MELLKAGGAVATRNDSAKYSQCGEGSEQENVDLPCHQFLKNACVCKVVCFTQQQTITTKDDLSVGNVDSS